MKRRIVLGWMCLVTLLPLRAQTMPVRSLSVEEMFRLAENNSKSLRTHRVAIEEAEQGITVAKSERLPSIEASLSFSYIGDGWMSDRNFSHGRKASMPHYGNNFALKATQVLYAGGAINRGIEMSELQQQVAQMQLDNNRQDIRFLLIGYYLDLCRLNNRKTVYERNIGRTDKLIAEVQASYIQGTALKTDITRYELQRKDLELGLTTTLNEMNILNRQLSTVIGLDEQTQIQPDTTLFTRYREEKDELAWQQERTSSPALKLADLSIQMNRKQEDIIRASRRPTVGLTAANNFDGPILIEVPPINKNFNYWYVGVGISYKFDALFKSNRKLKQAQIATRRAEESRRLADEQLSNGIHAAYIELDNAWNSLRTQEKSVQLAHENYGVVHNRYKNGLSLITDMLDAANVQLSSELELVNAQISILYQHFLLKKTTGTL